MSFTKIYGHRGASAYAPENTMAAFKKAVELGADGIELDIHLTKDGEIIIIHDEKVDRTTDCEGMVRSFTLEELQKLDAGSWFDEKFKDEKIPTLKEVLELIKNTSLILNIEIKVGYRLYPHIEEKLIALLKEYNMLDRCIISSFDHYSLVKIKELDPNIKTGVLYMSSLYKPWNYAKIIKADALHPHYLTVTKELIQGTFMNNLPINTYTVNDDKTLRNLAEAKITGIITNYPDKAKRIITEVQEDK